MQKQNIQASIFSLSLSENTISLTKNEILDKNPNINNFNLNSAFIYESILFDDYITGTKNYNSLKLNSNQLNNLFDELEAGNKKICKNQSDEACILIKKEFYDFIFTNKPIYPRLDNKSNNILNLLNKKVKNHSFSIRKLTKNYFDIYNEKITKSLVHNILKKKIGYRYLKTCLKNERANTFISKKQKFFFKVISRIILLRGNLIFLDECRFCNYNSNYRMWRRRTILYIKN